MSDLDKLRKLFTSRRGRWVPMPQVAQASSWASYRQRLSELKQRGLKIECRRGPKTKAGRVTSAYRCL